MLDDHGRWIERLRSTADVVVLGALVILALIAIGTAASVAFATRAGLAAHREIVQLLHLDGRPGPVHRPRLRAALFPGGARGLGRGVGARGRPRSSPPSELDQFGLPAVSFLPPLALSLAELCWLLLVPATAAGIAWGTARLSVISALHQFY